MSVSVEQDLQVAEGKVTNDEEVNYISNEIYYHSLDESSKNVITYEYGAKYWKDSKQVGSKTDRDAKAAVVNVAFVILVD